MSPEPRATPSGSDAAREESLAHLLGAFALNLPDPYPDRRDDSLWWELCRCVTNHRTRQHEEAEAETPEE